MAEDDFFPDERDALFFEETKEGPPELVRLDAAANLLWSWLCQPRRIWAYEHQCMIALQNFRGLKGGRLSEEEARATLLVAAHLNLIAIDDDRAVYLHDRSMGPSYLTDEPIVRARTSEYP